MEKIIKKTTINKSMKFKLKITWDIYKFCIHMHLIEFGSSISFCTKYNKIQQIKIDQFPIWEIKNETTN
jgi:hypothetical protein